MSTILNTEKVAADTPNQTPVDFGKFIQDALVTESNVPTIEVSPQFFQDILDVAVLSSMFLDQIKKHIFYRTQSDIDPKHFHHRPIDPVKAPELLGRLHEVVSRLHTGGLAHEMANPTITPLPVNTRLFHAFLGKFTESGELLEALSKAHSAGAPLDLANLREELGDDKWYDAIAFDALGADMNDVLNTVIAKLKKRYAVKYSAREAEQRNLQSERAVLESGTFMQKAAGSEV